MASGRPRAILGKENYIRFLEEKFGSGNKGNYWIFQGSPEIYDIKAALKAEHLKSWKVAAHKDRIKPGDNVIIWQTGKEAGCYALGEVVSEVGRIEEERYEKQYYKDTVSGELKEERVEIRITKNLVGDPVLWTEIEELPEFQHFKAGNQGTNFSATKEEFVTLYDITKRLKAGEYYQLKKIFPKEKVKKFLDVLRAFFKKHQLDPEDERVSFNIRPKESLLVFIIGKRYVFALEMKNGEAIYYFIHPKVVMKKHGYFSNNKGQDEMCWNYGSSIEGLEDKIEEGLMIELNRNHKSPYRRFTNKDFINDVFGRKVSSTEVRNSKKYWLYSPGDNGEHWEEFYEKGIMALGWDELGDLKNYNSKEELISTLQKIENTTGSKKNDATANFDFKNSISIGDFVIVKKGLSTLLGYGEVTSDYYFDQKREIYQKCRDVDWKLKGIWDARHRLVGKTLTELGWKETQIPGYEYYYERLMDAMNVPFRKKQRNVSPLPLNQILYGPPGTGKTFQLQDTYFKEFTVQESLLTREQYLENIVSELKWWQAAAIALLDLKKSKVTEIVSHELLLMKTKLSNSKNSKATLWGYLQHYTDPECEYVKVADRSSNPIFYKDQSSYWEVKEDLLEQFYPEAYSILQEVKNYHPNPDKHIKNYEFVTFHQSFSYEDFIEGIKPNLDEEEINVSYRIEDGIFKKMCLKADADRENRYALFIDEINRGNVSAIFGELITLIEDDKRLGEENELRVKLPYSKIELGVPPNLHIIGTMNTADRSVEALDTALRRRFTFEEVMPQADLLRDIDFDGFNLEELLSTINERIEALLDRDHTIGHSYFIKLKDGDKESLLETFQNKIIPLLQEYFYHDYEKIALILGAGFVERKEGKVSFAKFSPIDPPEALPSYHLKEVQDIEQAVRILLKLEDEAGE